MKRYLFLLGFTFSFIHIMKAQPNPGFEHWHSSYNSLIPDDWQTLNFLRFTLPPNPLSVTQAVGTDVHSGNYAMRMQTIYVSTNPAPQIIDDTVGVAFTGLINVSPVYYKVGFPYTSRPETLNFWFKYLPVGSDTGGAKINLRKFYDTLSHTIGEGSLEFVQTSSYTKAIVHITYYNDDIPDTCQIYFASSKSKEIARVGSTLFVDDVELTGWVGIDEQKKAEEVVKVFPNPAKEKINFFTKNTEASTLQIMDLTGKIIATSPFKPNENFALNIESFSEGTYLYSILDRKRKTLANGKFNVSK